MEGVDLNAFFDIAVYWLIGIVALVVAYNFWKGKNKIISNGVESEGIVFDMVTRSGAYGGANHPVVRFLTRDDVWVTETYDIGSSITFLKRGQKVDVIYNPQNPKEFILKADSKLNLKLIPLLVSALAIFFLVFGLIKLIQLL